MRVTPDTRALASLVCDRLGLTGAARTRARRTLLRRFEQLHEYPEQTVRHLAERHGASPDAPIAECYCAIGAADLNGR